MYEESDYKQKERQIYKQRFQLQSLALIAFVGSMICLDKCGEESAAPAPDPVSKSLQSVVLPKEHFIVTHKLPMAAQQNAGFDLTF